MTDILQFTQVKWQGKYGIKGHFCLQWIVVRSGFGLKPWFWFFFLFETKVSLRRPHPHRTSNATQSKWNLCAWMGVPILHASNIKGFAFEFAHASCVEEAYGPVHTGRVSTFACKFACKPFDVARNAVWTLPLATLCSFFVCACCKVLRILCELGRSLLLLTDLFLPPNSTATNDSLLQWSIDA